MKKKVLALKLHGGHITADGRSQKITLPKGCLGISFCFESKKAARDFWGKNVPLKEIEFEIIGSR